MGSIEGRPQANWRPKGTQQVLPRQVCEPYSLVDEPRDVIVDAFGTKNALREAVSGLGEALKAMGHGFLASFDGFLGLREAVKAMDDGFCSLSELMKAIVDGF